MLRESYFNTDLSILINEANPKNKDMTNCYGYLISLGIYWTLKKEFINMIEKIIETKLKKLRY